MLDWFRKYFIDKVFSVMLHHEFDNYYGVSFYYGIPVLKYGLFYSQLLRYHCPYEFSDGQWTGLRFPLSEAESFAKNLECYSDILEYNKNQDSCAVKHRLLRSRIKANERPFGAKVIR